MEELIWVQTIVTASLVGAILLQRGTSGLGTVFGGSVADSFRTKRGFEAFVFNLTLFLSVLFVTNSIIIAITSAR